MSELFNLPGMDLLRQAAQFGQPQAPSDATSTPQPKPAPGLGGGGGRSGSGTSRSAEQAKQKAAEKDWDEATVGLGEHNPEPVPDPIENKPKAKLKKVGWVAEKTQFQSNPEVFAEFDVPESEKFRTLVEFELLVKEKGRFKPVANSKTKTNADASGRAVVKVCIPKASAVVPSGEPIKAIFALKAKHCTANWSNGEGTEREVTETAEIQFKHTLVSGIHFAQNKSFIAPQYLKVFKEFESTLKTWWKENDSAHFVIFGHVERDEEDPGNLSSRRAQAAFAFLIGDYYMWGRIAQAERWGVWEQQSMLHGMGFYNGKVDGVSGPKTSKAIRDFIVHVNETEGKSLNPNLEFTQGNNLNELFRLYITGEKRKVEIHNRHIRSVAGNPYVGCRSFNRYIAGNELRAENRRATFLILSESFNYPVDFPCGTSTGPCEKECKKPGERTVKGFGCKFYDDLMKKETASVAPNIPKEIVKESSSSFELVTFPGFEGHGYVIQNFRQYQDKKIEVNPSKILDGLEESSRNHCVSLVRHFDIPQTASWRKGPRVCDMKASELRDGTVIATMRDGVYHSDSTGRSHAGIYIKHDDYATYLADQSKSSGVTMMDQYLGASVQERIKKYSANADEESKKATKEWTDVDGDSHTHRVKWVEDGEEYYVVLV